MSETHQLAPEPPEPTFWETLKAKLVSFGKKVLHWVLGPGGALIVVVVALVLVALGVKNIQLGGILGKLLGRDGPEKSVIDVANSVPEGRVDADGNLIPVGKADAKGHTQAKVVPIKAGGVFSDPNTVTFVPPGETKEVSVKLPVGVKAKDVDKVIVVKSGEFAVTVKDGSGISTKNVDDLLNKYR